MPVCKECGDEADEVFPMKVEGKRRKVCEDCKELLEEQAAIAEESEGAMQQMMGYKGRR